MCRAVDHLLRFRYRGEKAEGLVAELDVVIDRLWDAHDRDLGAAAGYFLGNRVGATLRAVAADGEQNVHAERFQKVHIHHRVLRPARGAQHRSAPMVNVLDHAVGQFARRFTLGRIEPLVTVTNADDGGHAVIRFQRVVQIADDVIDAGAKSAAGHNGRLGFGGLEEDFFPRARFFERASSIGAHAVLDFKQHAGVIRHEPPLTGVPMGKRRRNCAGPQRGDEQLRLCYHS